MKIYLKFGNLEASNGENTPNLKNIKKNQVGKKLIEKKEKKRKEKKRSFKEKKIFIIQC